MSVEIVAVAVLDSFMQSLEANGVVVTEHSEAAKSDEKEEFDVIAEKEWSRISVFPKIAPSDLFDITPYKYKKIKSEDWYNHIKSELLKKSKLTKALRQTKILFQPTLATQTLPTKPSSAQPNYAFSARCIWPR